MMMLRGVAYEKVSIYREPNSGDIEASRGGRISDRPLPRTRHEYGQFLLVALEVRSNGCLVDEAPQGAGSRKFTP